MTFGTVEIVISIVGGAIMYVLLSLFIGGLPIKNGGLRAAAMALWPLTLVFALCYLPILVWRAGERSNERG